MVSNIYIYISPHLLVVVDQYPVVLILGGGGGGTMVSNIYIQ